MPYLVILGEKFKKTVVIFEISTFKFVKNQSLIHTVNFGITSTFCKGLGSAFSECLSPDLAPLYKVCLCLFG